MLTIDEISMKLHNNKNFSNPHTPHTSHSQRTNLVHKAAFHGKSINMYLPMKVNSLSPVSHTEQNVITLRKRNLSPQQDLPIIRKKQNMKFILSSHPQTQKCIEQYTNVSNRLKHAFQSETNTSSTLCTSSCPHMNTRKTKNTFNIKRLLNKVNSIITNKDCKVNYYQLNDYKNKALMHKRSSRPLDELYLTEVRNHQLQLQKLILNVEYDNVLREQQLKRHCANENGNNIKKGNGSVTERKINVKKNNSNNCKDNDSYKVNTLKTEVSKKFIKKLHHNVEYYVNKYYKSQEKIEKERIRHIQSQVFPKESIALLIQSKKDIAIDKLKKHYHNSYFHCKNNNITNNTNANTNVDNTKEMNIKRNFTKMMDEHTLNAQTLMSRYKIEDYINLNTNSPSTL